MLAHGLDDLPRAGEAGGRDERIAFAIRGLLPSSPVTTSTPERIWQNSLSVKMQRHFPGVDSQMPEWKRPSPLVKRFHAVWTGSPETMRSAGGR
jgi:hypothetical protein